MFYTIKNDLITAQINDMGGELSSLKLNSDGCEYLWQGDPRYWSGRAYNLFPICGRLTDGKYTYNGETYEMNLHGFARKTVYEVESQSDDRITFILRSSEATKKIYPFDFELRLTYVLDGTKVVTTFNVKNTGGKELIFATGGHPGFNVPLGGEGSFGDYYIEFGEKCQPNKLIFSDTCYYVGVGVKFALEDDRILRLSHGLFDDDAIFLCNTAKSATLRSTASDKYVKLDFPKMKYVGFWHAPKIEAPHVCIEPWESMPADDGVVDDLTTKRDMNKLAAGGVFENGYSIEIG